MSLRHRLTDPDTQIRTGMMFLILASCWKWFLHPSTSLSESFIDGGTGLLYGISIGCLLLGVKRNARRRSGTERGRCA